MGWLLCKSWYYYIINYEKKGAHYDRLKYKSKRTSVSVNKHYNKDTLTRGEINALVSKKKIKNPSWLKTDKYKVDRGTYKLPVDGKPTENEQLMETPVADTKTEAAYVVSSLTGNMYHRKMQVS